MCHRYLGPVRQTCSRVRQENAPEDRLCLRKSTQEDGQVEPTRWSSAESKRLQSGGRNRVSICICKHVPVCVLCMCVLTQGWVCMSVSRRLFLCLLRPHMYVFVRVFGVSGAWRFKPFPFMHAGRRDLRPLSHTHTRSSDSRPGCHLFLLWVQSPAEQWGTIRSLQRGSGPFAAGLTDTDGGAHAKSLSVCVCVCASVFLLMSCLSLNPSLSPLSVFMSFSALPFYSLPMKGV